ncbi:hypothetical protein DICPUDRAFT_156407 [Dictyostelium purpureum]|uniref:FNIP repeat-containing protein n=1 Tax=Dictyostelium purpureum TaxID=5786 RepID=F0ZWH6_DICPU|nr:uncharacterized protein DICPUDRAFT_156407 [Dictyostelium purpureum]EGC31700.1 hypothetical protein DICPUDRAFT_156407 [Dictyostelium purpureum]|eukprot:XP_003291766.1 hypothetical protein DICPUDRAFT_156407 [Dictyostelium purpureum]
MILIPFIYIFLILSATLCKEYYELYYGEVRILEPDEVDNEHDNDNRVKEELKNSSNISDRNEIHKHILKFIEYSVVDLNKSQYDQFKYKSYITRLNWNGDTLPDKNEFPPFLTILNLFYCYKKLTPTTLPNTITTLRFGYEFNKVILLDTLPNSLTTLTFSQRFKKVVQPGTLPNSLTTLTFDHYYNQVVPPGTLPNNLTTLTFGNDFNQVILPGTLPRSHVKCLPAA